MTPAHIDGFAVGFAFACLVFFAYHHLFSTTPWVVLGVFYPRVGDREWEVVRTNQGDFVRLEGTWRSEEFCEVTAGAPFRQWHTVDGKPAGWRARRALQKLARPIPPQWHAVHAIGPKPRAEKRGAE